MPDIVIIEDSEFDAELLRHALKRVGVSNAIRFFSEGEHAISYLKKGAEDPASGFPIPGIIFIDMKLPGMGGLQILHGLKQIPALAKSLKIVISHLDDTQNIKQAYSAGAQSFLTKPLSEAELRELIISFPGPWSLTADRDYASPTFGSPVATKGAMV